MLGALAFPQAARVVRTLKAIKGIQRCQRLARARAYWSRISRRIVSARKSLNGFSLQAPDSVALCGAVWRSVPGHTRTSSPLKPDAAQAQPVEPSQLGNSGPHRWAYRVNAGCLSAIHFIRQHKAESWRGVIGGQHRQRCKLSVSCWGQWGHGGQAAVAGFQFFRSKSYPQSYPQTQVLGCISAVLTSAVCVGS